MKTKEKQYQLLLDLKKKYGFSRLGLMSNASWISNPTRTAFCMSRYKFVAKMLSGQNKVLEIGCADGFYSRIVKQHVKNLTIIDFDPLFIDDFRRLDNGISKINSDVHDIIKKPLNKKFDAAYCLDVLEHINPKDENKFLLNTTKSLSKNGTLHSTPQAAIDLLALKQSYKCNLFNFLTVSS